MNRRRGAGAAMRQANMSLWLWPTVAALAAFGVGLALSTVALGKDSFASTLFAGGASGARTVLTALVGGLVTALSVIFSLAITGLQVVHQQYSPRLLRNFMRDRGTKITLGVFAGAVAYMLAVVRALPGSDSPDPAPRLAVVVGMVLFMACVGVVAYFAQHITDSIRVHRAMQRVVAECQAAIDLAARTARRARTDATAAASGTSEAAAGSRAVAAGRTGYVQEIDLDGLALFAESRGLTLRLAPVIGDQVMVGTPVGWATPREGRELPDTGVLDSVLAANVEIGNDRSMDTDVAYGLRQIVDVAVRAMSPSLNDPYTAMQALDHLTMLLCRLAREDMWDGERRDAGGALLVSVPVLDLSAYVRLACDQPRRYGGHEPAVAMRLLKLLRDVAALAPAAARPALEEEIARTLDHAERTMRPTDDLAVLRTEAETARQWSAGEATTPQATALRL